MFEEVFDRELGKSGDRLAMMLKSSAEPVGHAAILWFVADRIVKIFLLRDAVSSAAEHAIESYIRAIGTLNWYLVLDKLDEALTALRLLFPAASQAVKPLIVWDAETAREGPPANMR
jgi:hypothetical protein